MCFLKHGQHDVVLIPRQDGDYEQRCMYCSAPLDEMIRSEEEWTASWYDKDEGGPSAYFKGIKGIQNRWGKLFPWQS